MIVNQTQNESLEEFDDIIQDLINLKGKNLAVFDLGCGPGNKLMLLKQKFNLSNLKGCEKEK